MDVLGQSSEHPIHGSIKHAFSYKKCCLFLLVSISLIILASGGLTLIIIFVLKPSKPLFTFQKVNISSYKFDFVSESTLFVSSVACVTLIATNPNKVGIRFGHSRFRILNDGLVVGMIRIPEFYQPARSNNVTIEIEIFFQCLDITTIMSGRDTNNFTIKVMGDIRVRLRLLHLTLPNTKVALDCDVAVDGRYLASTNELSSFKSTINHNLAHLEANSQAFSKKCSISFYL